MIQFPRRHNTEGFSILGIRFMIPYDIKAALDRIGAAAIILAVCIAGATWHASDVQKQQAKACEERGGVYIASRRQAVCIDKGVVL